MQHHYCVRLVALERLMESLASSGGHDDAVSESFNNSSQAAPLAVKAWACDSAADGVSIVSGSKWRHGVKVDGQHRDVQDLNYDPSSMAAVTVGVAANDVASDRVPKETMREA